MVCEITETGFSMPRFKETSALRPERHPKFDLWCGRRKERIREARVHFQSGAGAHAVQNAEAMGWRNAFRAKTSPENRGKTGFVEKGRHEIKPL